MNSNNIKQEGIEDTPSFGTSVNTDYILRNGKIDSGVKILLDIDKVLSAEEITAIEKTV